MSAMLTRRILLAMVFAAGVLPARAEGVALITPAEAHKRVTAGTLSLVDVRTPGEWAAEGVAEGAATIAMQDPQLGKKLDALTGGDRTAPIALICRTGARSGHVAKLMRQAGYTNVYSVDGGMSGNRTDPGWKRAGLPLQPKESE